MIPLSIRHQNTFISHPAEHTFRKVKGGVGRRSSDRRQRFHPPVNSLAACTALRGPHLRSPARAAPRAAPSPARPALPRMPSTAGEQETPHSWQETPQKDARTGRASARQDADARAEPPCLPAQALVQKLKRWALRGATSAGGPEQAHGRERQEERHPRLVLHHRRRCPPALCEAHQPRAPHFPERPARAAAAVAVVFS